MTEKTAKSNAGKGWLCCAAIIALCVISCFAQNGTYTTKKVLGLLGAVGIIGMMLFADKARIKRLMSPPSFALLAYLLLEALSTFYARSGKFAIAEFSCNLIAFAVFMAIVLFSDNGKQSFRRIAAVLATAAAPVGLLSIDAASCNILMRPVRPLLEFVGRGYDNTGAYFYSRLNTILGNPNIYAGLMSVACLMSLWLVLTSESRRQRILCTVLLMVNAVSYLLAFSMGSLGVFVAACVLMLVLSPKETRSGLFLLLLQTAVIALIVGAVSVKGFGDTITGSPLPMIMLVVGCVAACLLEIGVRGKLAERLADKGKLLIGAVAGIVVVITVYLIAALNVTGAYTFGTEGDFRRTADLPAGDYTLSVNASAPANVRVAYKNTNNLVQNNETDLANASTDNDITFTVPEDSKLVFFYISCDQPGVTVNTATYNGAKDGSVKLGYKLLPAFIADRIQDLTANGNVVQRGVYRQDAIKLWKTAPVFGRGLGGFENGVASVQDYYYETKYAHNHYVEALCDLGVLGLLAFLSMLGTAVWALVKSRKEKPLIVMLLAACVLQMFGQAVTDVTWSSGSCLPMFFAVLAAITVFCADSLRLKLPEKNKGGAVRWPVTAVCAVFTVLIGLNLIAQSKLNSDNLTLDDLKLGAKIDLFEANDYKMSYLMSNYDDETLAAKYAASLSRVQSNTITVLLAQYYANTGDFNRAFDILDRGAEYTRANAEQWQKIFRLEEAIVDPVGSLSAVERIKDDTYIKRVVNSYNKLCETNAQQLDDVTLTERNNTFLNKVLAISATDSYDMRTAMNTFSNLVLDTASAPDINADSQPDFAEVTKGSASWNEGGAFTADTDCTISFTAVIKNDGDYALTVQSSNAAGITAEVGGTTVTFDAAGKGTTPVHQLGDADSTTTITLHVPAGTTVERVIYTME